MALDAETASRIKETKILADLNNYIITYCRKK